MQLLVVGELWESLLLDRSGFWLDALEDGRVENIDTGIDTVANELLWLFNEAVDHGLAWVLHNNTVL